jgi:hypothetical protein
LKSSNADPLSGYQAFMNKIEHKMSFIESHDGFFCSVKTIYSEKFADRHYHDTGNSHRHAWFIKDSCLRENLNIINIYDFSDSTEDILSFDCA